MNKITAVPILPVKAPVPAQIAVERFLATMKTAATNSFPRWEQALTSGIDECALSYDDKRAVLEQHPLDDYYLAGVVALELAKVRRMFDPSRAAEVLSLVAEHVDALAKRTDRIVSDLVFFLIGRIDLVGAGSSLPHDLVVQGLLERLGVPRTEATAPLMHDLFFRQALAEPLACDVPEWWTAFNRKYALVEQLPTAAAVTQLSRPSSPRFL